jgi:SpoIID/LytB domain protein
MEKRRRAAEGGQNSFFSFTKKDDEMIRWYDREDHTLFDVCADDHCQRYQGISNIKPQLPKEAVRQTRGQVLTYGGELCDARFSKCCGGRTEEFQYCWEDTPKPYLQSFDDPYCNTHDEKILRQVLKDYDQETPDFYHWTVEYTQEELSELVNRRLKMDLGLITDLIPLERGKSGRIWKLKIVGTKGSFTIGKELEIRRALSETHLYSSNFEVEKSQTSNLDSQINRKSKISKSQIFKFILHGRGWGHGVGLCQIGAAVMGEQGKTYDEILLYYYRGASIQRVYG